MSRLPGLVGWTGFVQSAAIAIICTACCLSSLAELGLGVLPVFCAVADCAEMSACPLINTSPASIKM